MGVFPSYDLGCRTLVFQLYGRPLHPELFDILAVAQRCRREDYEVTVRITRHRPRDLLGKPRRST